MKPPGKPTLPLPMSVEGSLLLSALFLNALNIRHHLQIQPAKYS